MSLRRNGAAFLGILLIALTIECHARLTQVVDTHAGAVQGEILKTIWKGQEYSAFKGIPFAKPPLGTLRFKAPIEVEPWNNVLSTVKQQSDCVQLSETIVQGSEDCLYLNVYSPQTSFDDPTKMRLRPVMVWIYGGGFISGTTNSSVYGADFFLENDVVFVSINYRLGALGFLSVDHPEALGNAGLKDQSFALKWVQKNIANFAGDPNQVTIFGQSAGASSVEFQKLSPMSKGLFHRSISMSGSPLAVWSYAPRKDALRAAFRLGKELGHSTRHKVDLINYLRTVSPKDIILATKKLSLFGLDFVFKPTVENTAIAGAEQVFLPACPFTLYENGAFYKGPHMLGFTKEEALLVAKPFQKLKSHMNYARSIVENVGVATNNHSEWLLRIPTKISESNLRQLIKVASVVFFDAPIDITQRLIRNHSEPVYYYRVSYESEYAMHYRFGVNLTGVGHADDIGYIFNLNADHAPKDPNDPFNQFRKKMVKLWSNFAKYGNPTPDGENDQLLGVTWPDSGNEGWQLDIDEQLRVKPRMIDQDTELYERLVYLATPIISGCKKRLPSFVLP